MQPDELTPLERQLAACRPSAAGLDADAMLFAAGRAAARPGAARHVWPVLACGFVTVSLALGGAIRAVGIGGSIGAPGGFGCAAPHLDAVVAARAKQLPGRPPADRP
jgi:hypothetical protein